MSVLLNTNNSGVVFFGPRSNPRAVRWWAERGLLHWEDSRDNGYGAVSVREFLLRLNGISEMLSNGRTKDNEGFLHADEVERHMKFVEEALELVRKAKEQGVSHLQVSQHKATLVPSRITEDCNLSSEFCTASEVQDG